MDVTDTGTRDTVDYIAEEQWRERLKDHPDGLDPRTNYREHHDPVATATATSFPNPVEADGSIIGGEKERVLSQIWVDQGMPVLIGLPDSPSERVEILTEELGSGSFVVNDPYDMFTPIGTPEGLRPGKDEVW